MQIVDKISYWIDAVSRSFLTIFLSVMTIALFGQIIARYFFQTGVIWTDELSRFLMVSMVFLGAAVATRDKSHITVSIFEDMWPSSKKWLAPIQSIVVLIYAIIVIKFGLDTLEVVKTQSSPNMRISMGIVYSIIPISAIIMSVHLAAQLTNRKKSEEGKVK